MIPKKYISKNLKELNELYLTAKGSLKPQFYAKLAVIEACGWIEECMDSVVDSLSNNSLNAANKAQYKNETVNKTSGFKYQSYIRNKLLKDLVGLVLVEKMETTLATNVAFVTMQAALNNLSSVRNDNAHTHISGTTPTIIAPSQTIQYFEQAYNGIKIMNGYLKKIKFK